MYKLFTFFIGCLLLLSCREQQKASPFFEGYVEYDLKTEVLDTLTATKWMAEKKGRKMTCFFKNGSFLREYYDSNNIAVLNMLYLQTENSYYYISNRGPIFQKSAAMNPLEMKNIQLSEGETKKILNYDCPSVKIAGEYIEAKNEERFSIQYFFCKDLIVDTSLLKDFTVGGYDQALKRHPNVALGMTEELPGHSIERYTATRIVPVKVRDEKFAIPTDREIRKL